MTKIKEYFNTLNLSALPQKASNHITSVILTDPDLELLDENDEDFVAVKELIEESYKDALSKASGEKVASDKKQDLLDRLELLNEMLVDTTDKKKVSDLKDRIELIEEMVADLD